MLIINSFKVLVSNFSLVYKSWLYKFIVFLIILAVAAAIFLPNLLPVFEDLEELGVINMTKNVLQKILTFSAQGGDISEDILNIVSISGDVFQNHASHLLRTYIATGVLAFLLYFLNILGEFPTAGVLFGYMELQANFGFVASILSNFRKALNYSLLKLAIVFPIDIVCYAIPILILIFSKGLFAYIAPFFAIIAFLLLFSLRSTFICCWLPHYLNEENGAGRAFKESLKYVEDKFGRIYSHFVIIYSLIIPITLILTLFSFGVLGIILPAVGLVFFRAFNFAIYFAESGKRYYVDSETIIIPKKLRDRESSFIYDLKE